ncbi:MAG: regulatory protein RecX [Wenzhouxiangellaceae bacterium]|nr:regulatory protein RecX [Wenzhouxiangellaceae bacterium]
MPGPDERRRAGIRDVALRLLGRREHSALELSTKLRTRGGSGDDVEAVIARLAEAGLQSDERFAESFARARAERGYGPRRIVAELVQRGVERHAAAHAIEALEVDFCAIAEDFCRRRYRDAAPPEDVRERARRSQALYRRGFEAEHVRGLV